MLSWAASRDDSLYFTLASLPGELPLGIASYMRITGLAARWWEHREVPRDEVVAVAMDLLFVGIERVRVSS